MSIDLIKFAFVAGEISPNFFGRPDLEKFDLALALGENWFVDYRGGVSTRAGTEFIDYIKDDDKPIKLVDFKFSSDIANTNVLILGHFYIRFVQDGAYVLEASKNITGITEASPAVVTVAAHGLSNDDWVKIDGVSAPNNVQGETFRIAGVTANTFQLKDAFGNDFSTVGAGAYISGGTVARIYTVTSPWDSAHLEDLKHHQVRDTLRFTHKNYKTRNLERLSANDWALSELDLTNNAAIPSGISSISHGTGAGWGFGYVVTAVDSDGLESLGSDMHISADTDNPFNGMKLEWDPVPGAIYYNVYKTRQVGIAAISRSMSVGFIGRSSGASFVDGNIIPDFTRTPPQENNPFGDGQIEYIDVTNGGANYDHTSTVSIADPNGTGFEGFLVIGSSFAAATGAVTGVVIRKHGTGYTAPVVSDAGAGSGATYSAEVSPLTGNNPAVGTIFQQRQVYAATENKPLTIFGSRPLRFDDFGASQVILANDGYEHDIDSDSVAPIRHLVPTRGGLIVINENGIWLLSGSNNRAVTPTDAQADSQAYKGATKLTPLKIDTDLLYQEGQGGSIRLLSYNDINKVYSGVDMSILANHLFGVNKRIKAWAYSDEPFKLVWAQREDGVGLSFTLLKEQQVYAWMRQTTKGLFQDMLAVQEDQKASVYTVVQRFIDGRWAKFLERFSARDFVHVEDAWCVDCALKLGVTQPEASIQIAASTGDNVEVKATSGVFAVGDVGKILRAAGGKMEVISFTDAVTINVKVLRAITETVPQTNDELPVPVASGFWSLDTPVTTIRGLRHLEGQTVKVLADGNVLTDKVVTNGTIVLEKEATRVIVGLGYRCLLKTLPPTISGVVVEDKPKRIVGIAARVRESRGITFGAELDHLYPMKERTTEDWGEPTMLQEGIHAIPIEPQWDMEAQVYIVQDSPLPATLLGFVANTEVGDDDDLGKQD